MQTITITLTYLLNGLLALLYWLAAHRAALGGLALAAASTCLLDAPQARHSGTLPRRYERGSAHLTRPALHLPTLALGLLWTLAAWITPPPVPCIGLAMWAGALLAPLALPFGKRKALHRLRWFIGVYAALVLAFWLLARSSSRQRLKVPKSWSSRSLRSVMTTRVGFCIAGCRTMRPA